MKTKGRFMSSLQTILRRLLKWTQVLENSCEGKSKTSLSPKHAAKLNLTANCWQKERSEMDASRMHIPLSLAVQELMEPDA